MCHLHVLLHCDTHTHPVRERETGYLPVTHLGKITGKVRCHHESGRVPDSFLLHSLSDVSSSNKHRGKKMLTKSRFSTKYNENQVTLINYLKTQLHNGRCFLKSKYIAKELGLSSKEVGTNMAILSEICPDFTIERYSYSNSTTWLVSPGSTQGFQRRIEHPVASV